MPIVTHDAVEQGSDEWHALRCGILTASEMRLVLTSTLKIANNDKTRAHIYEIAAQRISGHTEASYVSDDMLRGMEDEITARDLYAERYGDVVQVGFITNDDYGFMLGYSPDGLVGDDGLIEIKSRRQKFQIETIVNDAAPDDYMMQLQVGLFVTGRKWIDYVTYSAGLPMYVKRVYPSPEYHDAIIEAGRKFEADVRGVIDKYNAMLADPQNRMIPTERITTTDEELVV